MNNQISTENLRLKGLEETLGKKIFNFKEYHKRTSFFFANDLCLYPFEITVQQVYTNLGVGLLSFYYPRLELSLEYHFDLYTILSRGSEIIPNRSQVWINETHKNRVFEAVYDQQDVEHLQLQGHLQYFFEMIHGHIGYKGDSSLYNKYAQDETTANVFIQYAIQQGLSRIVDKLPLLEFNAFKYHWIELLEQERKPIINKLKVKYLAQKL